MPKNSIKEWVHNIEALKKMFIRFQQLAENGKINEASGKIDLSSEIKAEKITTIAIPQMALYMATHHLKMKAYDDIDFQRLFISQELVMVLAQLEAFFSDSLRVICDIKPEILKIHDKIEWATVIDFGTWERLKEFLIEKYVFDFGYNNIKDQIEFLNSKIGLNIEIPDLELDTLEEAGNIRNIVVHNSGRINQEYIKKSRNKIGLTIGDFIPITNKFMKAVSGISATLACDIFVLISKKFFNIEDSIIEDCIWRGRLDEYEESD